MCNGSGFYQLLYSTTTITTEIVDINYYIQWFPPSTLGFWEGRCPRWDEDGSYYRMGRMINAFW